MIRKALGTTVIILMICLPIYMTNRKEMLRKEVYTYAEERGCVITDLKLKRSLSGKWNINININKYKFVLNYKKNTELTVIDVIGDIKTEYKVEIINEFKNGVLCVEKAPEDESKVEVTNDKISMKTLSIDTTNSTILLEVTNHTDNIFDYNEGYKLEIDNKGHWIDIASPREQELDMPLYKLEANNTINIEIIYKNIYGSLGSGKYRLIKYYYTPENATEAEVIVAAEFSVK